MDVVIAKGTIFGECTTEKTGIEIRRYCANQHCNTVFTAVRHMQEEIMFV